MKIYMLVLCISIDVNSRFECSPGKKDVEAIRTFLQKVRR